MAKMKIAVTGGSGHIGRAVVTELLSRGHEVVNLDKRSSPDRNAPFVWTDLRDRAQLHPVFERVDAVVHLGEIPGLVKGMSPEEVYATNTAICGAVMQTAADAGIRRLVYASSCQVYGSSFFFFSEFRKTSVPARLPFDETAELNPQNAYATSKVANESYVRMIVRQTALAAALMRFPFVTAQDSNDELWIRTAQLNSPFEGMGTYLHTTDAGRAVALAVESDRPGCEAYHFSAREIFMLRPLREFLAEYHKNFPPLPADWPAHKSPLLLEKAREHFGWEPAVNVLDVVRAKVATTKT